MIYRHEALGMDRAITDAIDTHLRASKSAATTAKQHVAEGSNYSGLGNPVAIVTSIAADVSSIALFQKLRITLRLHVSSNQSLGVRDRDFPSDCRLEKDCPRPGSPVPGIEGQIVDNDLD